MCYRNYTLANILAQLRNQLQLPPKDLLNIRKFQTLLVNRCTALKLKSPIQLCKM